MAKKGYYAIHLTESAEKQIREICERLGISPDARGAYSKAIKFALQFTVYDPEIEQKEQYLKVSSK